MWLFGDKKLLPLDVRTSIHNLEVKMRITDSINKQLIKKNSALEERIAKLEKIIILNKLE
ncbi:hypothetical protein M0R36_11355 [bacterium]|jgi:hypothetical protein|nr:hypothetical protein [bacterium]